MSLLNRGRKLFYLASITLLAGHIVIRSNFRHTKVTPTVPQNLIIGKLKVATAMLKLSSTGLFCIGCFTAGLGAGEAEGLGPGLKQSVIILYYRTQQQKIIQVASVDFFFIGVKNYFKWLGVALLDCRLNQSFYGRCMDVFLDCMLH